MTSGRRTFLRRTLGGVAGLAVADASQLNAATSASDDPWLAAIAAKKHKAFMDVMHFFPDGTPFRRAEAAALKAGAGTFAAAVLAQARGVGYVALA